MLKRLRGFSGTSNTDLKVISSPDSTLTISTANNNIRSISNDNKPAPTTLQEKLKLNLIKRTTNHPDNHPKTDRPNDDNNDNDDHDFSVSYSISAPTSPKHKESDALTRNRRDSKYLRAIEEATIKGKQIQQQRALEVKLSPKSDDISETNEYYSAYYNSNDNENDKDKEDNTELDDTNNNHNTTTQTMMQSPRSMDDSDYSEIGRSPGRVSPKSIYSDLPNSTPNNQANLVDIESNDNPPLPEIPKLKLDNNLNNNQIGLPVERRSAKKLSRSENKSKLYFATLSRTLDLKHPCSPRLMESRQELIEYQKILGLQTMLFNLRVDFWKIENSRLMAIENYQNLAREAGLLVCDNCKRLLRNRERTKKYGNYHQRSTNPDKPHRHPRYKCTQRTFDDHILNSSASKYYPIPLDNHKS